MFNYKVLSVITIYTITISVLLYISDIIEFHNTHSSTHYTATRHLLQDDTTDDTYSADNYWLILILSPILYAVVSCTVFIVNVVRHYMNKHDISSTTHIDSNQNTIQIQQFTTVQKLLFMTYKLNQKLPLLISSTISLLAQLTLLVSTLVYGWEERCGGASGIVLHWLICMRIATIILSLRITVSQLNTHSDVYSTPLSDKACQLGWNGLVCLIVGIVPIVYQPLYDDCAANAPLLHDALLGIVGIALVQILSVVGLMYGIYRINKNSTVTNSISTQTVQPTETNSTDIVVDTTPATYQSTDNTTYDNTNTHNIHQLTTTTTQHTDQIMVIVLRCILRHLLIGLAVAPKLLGCQLDEQDALCGLELTYLPITTYGSNDNNDINDTCCSICLTDYVSGDRLKQLSCGHRFHAACLDNWLQIRSTCCYCRATVSIMKLLDQYSLYSVLFNAHYKQHVNTAINPLTINTLVSPRNNVVTPSTPLGSTPRRGYRTLESSIVELNTVA